MLIASLLLAIASTSTSAAAPMDACHLLTAGDLTAVLGQSFTEIKPAGHTNLSSCFYQLPVFTNSVSVDLMRPGGRKYWADNLENEKLDQEAEKTEHPPLKISGVGQQAIWISNRAGGSLFVRQGDALLRISIGGAAKNQEKLARSKRLAIRALKKL